MNEKQRLGKKYHSATHYILSALVPYTEANLKLSFKPHLFFNDLEKLDALKAKKKSIRTAYYRAIKRGLIIMDENNMPKLTAKGMRKTALFKPKKLGNGAKILLIFDIPEADRWKRHRVRALLRELSFTQVQKSVWECRYGHREYIKAEMKEIGLGDCIILYEALQLKP